MLIIYRPVEETTERTIAMAAFLNDVISSHTSDVYGINLLVNESRWYLDAILCDKMMREKCEYYR